MSNSPCCDTTSLHRDNTEQKLRFSELVEQVQISWLEAYFTSLLLYSVRIRRLGMPCRHQSLENVQILYNSGNRLINKQFSASPCCVWQDSSLACILQARVAMPCGILHRHRCQVCVAVPSALLGLSLLCYLFELEFHYRVCVAYIIKQNFHLYM